MGDDGDSPVFNNPELVETLAKSNINFALALYKRVAVHDENILLSPLGLSAVLAMALGGASGETAAQMKQTMHLDAFEENEPVHLAFQDVLTSVSTQGEESETPIQLRMANRLFLQSDVPVADEFAALLEQHYGGSSIDSVNFAQEADEARQTIDAWVAEATDGKVVEMVGEGVLDLFSVLVLISAVYFKGTWTAPFRQDATKLLPFQSGGGRKAMVDMMYTTGTFRLATNEDLGCQILELPFAGGRLQMLVLLPTDPEGLAEVEDKLDADNLASLLDTMEETQVKVSLPRFHVDCKFSLSDVLAELGMSDLFTQDAADLSNMSEGEGLLASAALHRAFIEVDEGEGESEEGEDEEGEEFVADHPFLFMVKDSASQIMILLGRLQTPAIEELLP